MPDELPTHAVPDAETAQLAHAERLVRRRLSHLTRSHHSGIVFHVLPFARTHQVIDDALDTRWDGQRLFAELVDRDYDQLRTQFNVDGCSYALGPEHDPAMSALLLRNGGIEYEPRFLAAAPGATTPTIDGVQLLRQVQRVVTTLAPWIRDQRGVAPPFSLHASLIGLTDVAVTMPAGWVGSVHAQDLSGTIDRPRVIVPPVVLTADDLTVSAPPVQAFAHRLWQACGWPSAPPVGRSI